MLFSRKIRESLDRVSTAGSVKRLTRTVVLGSVSQSKYDYIFNKYEKCWHVTSEPMLSNFAFSTADGCSVIDNIKGCQDRKL
jgi:hypothetical protein